MIKCVSAMLHVPDVGATADWYAARGFPVRDRGSDGAEVVFAAIAMGDSEILLSAGGQSSEAFRREADLYVSVEDVDRLFDELAPQVEVIEPPHDTFYGAREFVIRDCNRFWLTFGEPGGARKP